MCPNSLHGDNMQNSIVRRQITDALRGVGVDFTLSYARHFRPCRNYELKFTLKCVKTLRQFRMSYITGGSFFVFCMLLEAAFIVIFARLADYGDSARPIAPETSEVDHAYPSFQDVHVMIFIGFGFLMTFLKRYGYTAVGVNMLIGSFVIQWALIVRGLIHNKVLEGAKFHINVEEMLAADFASATCLISFGALLGKTSPLQLLIMALIEVALAQTNKYICEGILYAADAGESMYIHAFGAYFGLAAATVMYRKDAKECEKNGPVYNSDLFSMIGTIFLWMYWPSFNSGAFKGDEQHRAIINTYLSLTACTVVTFAFSGLLHKGKFEMVHVQNATLAGGVAVGTTAHMVLHPWGALLLGLAAGMLSTLGYHFIQPFLLKYLRIHDTCGVNNLHGMPGILAGVAGSIVAALASADVWGNSRFDVFPQMVPPANTTEFVKLNVSSPNVYEPGFGRSAAEQGAYQIAALGVTLAMAIGSGIFTGLVLKIPIFDEPQEHELFDDHHWWNVPAGIPADKEETVADSGEMKIFKKTEESNGRVDIRL